MKIRFNKEIIRLKVIRLRSFLNELAGDIHDRISRYFTLLIESGRIRFLTFSWSVVIIYSGIHLLASINPLSLLIPGMLLPYPVRDQRSPVLMHTGSPMDGGESQIHVKILTEDADAETLSRRIMFALSKPDLYQDRDFLKDGSFVEIHRLPDFGYAVRKIWYRNDGGLLIVDLNEGELRRLAGAFIAKSGNTESKDVSYFDAYFSGLTETILEMKGPVKRIVYLVDGESRSIAGMGFDLAKAHTNP